jgi:tRNA A-37 threonylcarbamoyl transferase component Bud32
MRITLDGIRWDYLSEKGHSWLSALRTTQLQGVPIKPSIHRCVFRLSDGIFIKDVRYNGLRSLFKSLRGGNACKEGRIALELARRGILVPEVLGFGSDRYCGLLRRDLLVTKEVPNGKPLSDFIKKEYANLSFESKNNIIRVFATFIKQLHDVGTFHKDLHLGNILIQRTEEKDSFVLLDLYKVRLKRGRLSRKERAENLGVLLSIFWTLCSVVQRFRFLKCYGIQWQQVEERNHLAAIKKSALKINRKIWNKRSRLCLSTNTRFINERSGTFKIHRVRRPDVERLLGFLLPDPDRVLEQGILLKDGRTVKAAKIELDGQWYFLKRYNCKGWHYQLKNAFRRSRAVRTWSVTWGFLLRSLPVPEPLICLEERHFRLLRRSYILSECIENPQRLADVWVELDDSGKRRLITRLAMMFGRMHQFGGFHGDLKWNNILIQPGRDRERIILCDMDGGRIYRRTRFNKALKDLRPFLRDKEKWDGNEENEAFFMNVWQKWSGVLNCGLGMVRSST